jgi:hypothetical protein
MKKIIPYLILFLLPTVFLAQNITGKDKLNLPKTPRRYHTQKNHENLLVANKDMASRRAFVEMSIRDGSFNALPNEVTIPVVVHIIYPTGTDTKKLPSENELRKQLDNVSKDFRQAAKIEKHQADTKEKFSDKNALDTKISFCLASVDPKGNATNGIRMIPTERTSWQANDKMKFSAAGGDNAWATDKYLNIWVVNFPDSISGYAQMPAGPAETDGIVVDARYVGKLGGSTKDSPYTEGKTLTHLIGSYLNLYELWSETTPCGDDAVDDTPIHNAPNLGSADYKHISTCDGNPVEMTMNFMDNTNDESQYMFTNGQKRRLQACLAEGGIRARLVIAGEKNCKKTNINLQAAQTRNDVQPLEPSNLQSFSYRIYPNPAQDFINLEIATEKTAMTELTILNAQGSIQKQMNYTIGGGNQVFEVKCNDWSSGLYFIRIKVNGEVKTEKIIIYR